MSSPAHVLITGAAGAIGAALARTMRETWPACRLALLDLPAHCLRQCCAPGIRPACRRETAAMVALADELGNASVHGFDLRHIDELPALIESIATHQPLDGLVNCAGIMRVQHVGTWGWQAAHDLMTIDLLAPLRLQDLVVRGLLDRNAPHGFIVNVASMAGKVPLKGCAYYGASKAGLAMASEVARADLAPHGIRVVTVYPGPVRSALEQGARDAWGGGGLLGRLAPTGEPSELARRILAAIESDEPRVIYPRLYSVGWSATNLSSWLALSYGPPPVG
jgi:short-subunit dehydrogenase